MYVRLNVWTSVTADSAKDEPERVCESETCPAVGCPPQEAFYWSFVKNPALDFFFFFSFLNPGQIFITNAPLLRARETLQLRAGLTDR